MLDKTNKMCYNNYRKKRKEVIKMMYFKSTLTGQIYELAVIPMGKGWELSTKEEYEAWKKARGLM